MTAPSPDERKAAERYWTQTCPEVTRQRTALFYSRFHRKKRVLELVDLWLATAPADWLLLMVGVPEDYTPRQLETYIMRTSGSGRIRVFDGQHTPPPYAVAQLFLLPSHSENFGLVVAEAMSHGLSVIVTDTTPWSHLNRLGAGWCVSWHDYPATLKAALAEAPSARSARGELGRRHVGERYSWPDSARTLHTFYEQLRITSRGI